jgi:hypothetical protein
MGGVFIKNLSAYRASANFESKRKLQHLVFPKGILYSKKKGAVRTEVVNSLFAEIPLVARVSEENEKGDSIKNRLKSYAVPRTSQSSNFLIQSIQAVEIFEF